jgi:peptidoglycan/LPS O-acetylase OafA/YrhL
MTINKKH